LPDLTFFRHAGGVIGSFEFSRARFGCAIVKNIDIETCGIATWINAFTWPYIAVASLLDGMSGKTSV
jgi:hypothetical protein